MARARQIKHGFFTNDELGALPPLTRLLFAGLWTMADREGRLLDRPLKIKADVLPYDKHDVDKALEQLAGHDFIVRYEIAGRHYIQVVNWHKHQSPHPREAESEIPPAPGLSNGMAAPEPLPDPGGDAVAPLLGNGMATAEPGVARARPGTPASFPSFNSNSYPPNPPASRGARARARKSSLDTEDDLPL